jgi:signal transduction histidine kinase
MSFKTKVIGGFGAAIAILALLAVFSYGNLVENDTQRARVTHTHVVIESVDTITSELTEAEAVQRGFIITGLASYRDDFQSAADKIHENIAAIRRLTIDNPIQQRNIDRLEPLVDARLAEIRQRIEQRQQSGLDAAAKAIAIGRGKEHMDEILALLGSMHGEENSLLVLRTTVMDTGSRRTKVLILAGNALALFFALLVMYVLQQEMARRLHADEMLRQANADLERRVAERTADLARSNSELQQFAYVASHDLQEPLRMVASFTQLLAKRYKDKLDDDAREFIDFAVDGATRMQTLITDLLMYSRVGTQGKPLERTECDAVLDRVLSNLKLTVQENGAEILREPLPAIFCDPIQLGQLFQNLIVNSIKFRGRQPPKIHIFGERHGDDWQIAVRDNGIGIDPQQGERIFVIFQRLHTKTEYPGTGIGLAICKKIAERHGGRIWVEPSPGGGSTFRFTVPVISGGEHASQSSNENLDRSHIDDSRVPVASR